MRFKQLEWTQDKQGDFLHSLSIPSGWKEGV